MAGRRLHRFLSAALAPVLVALGALATVSCSRAAPPDGDSTAAKDTAPAAPEERADERARMVARYLAPYIHDEAVLEAMRRVPRHRFVPPEFARLAYADRPLPIGHEQTISQPYIVALMTELLELGPESRVLEIGTGSGYQAAVLAELAGEVRSIELLEPLAKRAAEVLVSLGYENLHLRVGDGYLGWPEAAPFDAIIVTCAPEAVPAPLQEQLAEGGRLVIPVGEAHDQRLVLVRKIDGELRTREVVPVRFVPMVDESGAVHGE